MTDHWYLWQRTQMAHSSPSFKYSLLQSGIPGFLFLLNLSLGVFLGFMFNSPSLDPYWTSVSWLLIVQSVQSLLPDIFQKFPNIFSLVMPFFLVFQTVEESFHWDFRRECLFTAQYLKPEVLWCILLYFIFYFYFRFNFMLCYLILHFISTNFFCFISCFIVFCLFQVLF